jgi:hypothetical protein
MSLRVVRQMYERKMRSELGLRELTDELIDQLVAKTSYTRPNLVEARELGFQYSTERGTLFRLGGGFGAFGPDAL